MCYTICEQLHVSCSSASALTGEHICSSLPRRYSASAIISLQLQNASLFCAYMVEIADGFFFTQLSRFLSFRTRNQMCSK